MSHISNDVVSIECCGQELLYHLPDPDDHIQKTLRVRRRLYEEDALIDSLARDIPPGLVLDVGANIGNHTVFFAKVLQRRVVALEPWAKAFHVLWRNVALNNLSEQVTLIAKAAGAATSAAEIKLPPKENWGQASIAPMYGGPIDIVRLDDLGITDPVALIKVDVEGMELDVLKGASALIEKYRPVLYVEAQTAFQYAELRTWLRRFGYQMIRRFNYTPTYAFVSCDSLDEQVSALLEKTESLSSMEELAIAHREISRSLPERESLLRRTVTRSMQRLMRQQSRAMGESIAAAAEQSTNSLYEKLDGVRQSLQDGMTRQIEKHQEMAEGLSAATKKSATEMQKELTSVRHSLEIGVQRCLEQQQVGTEHAERELAEKMQAVRQELESELSRSLGAAVQQIATDLGAKVDRLSNEVRQLSQEVKQPNRTVVPTAATDHGDDSAALSLPLAELPVAIRLRRQGIGFETNTPLPTQIPTPNRTGVSAVAGGFLPPKCDETETVSVIMTTYNSARFVEAAIRNVLGQTHFDLELIIVDDASTDETFQILSRLAREDSRVRPMKMFTNRGTYWCKNFGILHSKGRYVTFQDSDDASDVCRIGLQLDELKRSQSVMCTCNYVRVDANEQVMLNRGKKERKAIMAPLIDKEEVIRRAGYFDSVRTSADDEFTRRIGILFGSGRICHVNKPLYRATVREGSLTNAARTKSEINTSNGSPSDDSFLSPPRREYVRQYKAWHETLTSHSVGPAISFPQFRRPFPVPPLLAAGIQQQDNYVTASMASIPARESLLKETVQSIINQVDVLNVYLNGYESTPAFLKHGKIRTVHSTEYGDRRDNGKFFFLDSLLWGYHFTIDDDIVYPPDYVQRLVLKIEQYNRQAIVGTHGVILADPIVRFMEGRQVLHFKRALSRDRLVNLLGTGTTAYHTGTLQISSADFKEPGMADVWLAIAARRQNVPLLAIQRPERWLVPQSEADECSLFTVARQDDSLQTAVIRKEGSWRIEDIYASFPLVTSLLKCFSSEELASSGLDLDEINGMHEQVPGRRVEQPDNVLT